MSNQPTVTQTPVRSAPALPAHGYDGPAIVCVEQFWREGGRCFAQGWAHANEHPVLSMTFLTKDGAISVRDFRPRSDLLSHYPAVPNNGAHAGFSVFLPAHDSSELVVEVEIAGGKFRPSVALPPHLPVDEQANSHELTRWHQVFDQFCREVNDNRLEILEVGSRIVGSETKPYSDRFPHAARFVGMDVHPGHTVDIVGDVHRLSKLVGAKSFDAIYSVAVLEHLAMPWLAAVEMNHTLRLNGLVYHEAPQTWPVHEMPNDFWRFTDKALEILFGSMHGFEILHAGMCNRLMVYPIHKEEATRLEMPFATSYGTAYILARKISDIQSINPDLEKLTEQSRRYPNSAGTIR
jgi:hypothetical protein